MVGADAGVVEPVEAFLVQLHAMKRSPNTVRAYAHELWDWFEFCRQSGLVWSRVGPEDVGWFVAWLRLAPAARNEPNVVALPAVGSVGCSESTVNRKLSTVSAFYEFRQRRGVDLGICWSSGIGAARVVVSADRCWCTWVLVRSGRVVSGSRPTNTCR